MNYLFTICGRAGSKGLKNKNLKKLAGSPLVYHSLAAILLYINKYGKNNHITVVLSTDSEELIDIVTAQTKLPVFVIRREEALCGDATAKIDVIKDCLLRSEKEYLQTYDIIIDLDITSPLRRVVDVKNAIDRKSQRMDADVVYSVTHSRRNPYFNMVREEKCSLEEKYYPAGSSFFVKAVPSDYTARQQAPFMYDMNASIYAYSPEALKTKPGPGFFNDKADAIIMKDTAVLDIDSEEDFELMQVIAGHFYEKDYEYREIWEMSKEIGL
ncbi:MAG: acylneuraminate cytidylyltransferase family protein [Lachnospiraceae bacterium]|nr:acylneuraminate cytidylyltransferase family protein [Lachnospiraceae bacterium]